MFLSHESSRHYPDPMDVYSVPQLNGELITLEPLSLDHAPELAEAIAEDDLYKAWYTRLPTPDRMAADIESKLARHDAQQCVPWAIRRTSDGRAIGVTTFLNIRADNKRLEIGSTWLTTSAQGTGINAEAKLLLLTRAFEALDCIAVEFRTHWHNRRSRAAIAALGAKQGGVLRNHDVWRDGTVRDVVVFSIIDREWPTVRLGLQEKLRSRTG